MQQTDPFREWIEKARQEARRLTGTTRDEKRAAYYSGYWGALVDALAEYDRIAAEKKEAR